jgi:hypothetical protein
MYGFLKYYQRWQFPQFHLGPSLCSSHVILGISLPPQLLLPATLSLLFSSHNSCILDSWYSMPSNARIYLWVCGILIVHPLFSHTPHCIKPSLLHVCCVVLEHSLMSSIASMTSSNQLSSMDEYSGPCELHFNCLIPHASGNSSYCMWIWHHLHPP